MLRSIPRSGLVLPLETVRMRIIWETASRWNRPLIIRTPSTPIESTASIGDAIRRPKKRAPMPGRAGQDHRVEQVLSGHQVWDQGRQRRLL